MVVVFLRELLSEPSEVLWNQSLVLWEFQRVPAFVYLVCFSIFSLSIAFLMPLMLLVLVQTTNYMKGMTTNERFAKKSQTLHSLKGASGIKASKFNEDPESEGLKELLKEIDNEHDQEARIKKLKGLMSERNQSQLKQIFLGCYSMGCVTDTRTQDEIYQETLQHQ